MNETKKYFGMSFPCDCSLAEEQMSQLAKLLFLSPTTSAEEAQTIITNSKIVNTAANLMSVLQEELSELRFQNNTIRTDEQIDFDLDKTMSAKLEAWSKIFGLPSEDELNAITYEMCFENSLIWKRTIFKLQTLNFFTPEEIASYLKDYIIGQEDAVKTMSVIVNNHKMKLYKSSNLPNITGLFIGSTGSGKSYMINKARELLDVPMVRIPCGELVPAGIVGNTISDYFTRLYVESDSNTEKMSLGIIQFDEIDKLSNRYYDSGDKYKTTIQFEILKLFDLNEPVLFPETFRQFSDIIEINTNNLLLIFSGAFNNIEEYIIKRLLLESDGNTKFFDMNNVLQYVESSDIQNYGIIPELSGRLSYITVLEQLNETDYFQIMKKAKDSELSKHIKKCQHLGINLRFTDSALRFIANVTVQEKLGVRYMHSLFSVLLKELYFFAAQYQGKEYLVDKIDILTFLFEKKYKRLVADFRNNVDLHIIANKYNVDIDTVLDIFIEYKNLKK